MIFKFLSSVVGLLSLSVTPLVASADLRDQYQSNGQCDRIYANEKRTEFYCIFNMNVYEMESKKVSGGIEVKRTQKYARLGIQKRQRIIPLELEIYYPSLPGEEYLLEEFFIEGPYLVLYQCTADFRSTTCPGNVKRFPYRWMTGDLLEKYNVNLI